MGRGEASDEPEPRAALSGGAAASRPADSFAAAFAFAPRRRAETNIAAELLLAAITLNMFGRLASAANQALRRGAPPPLAHLCYTQLPVPCARAAPLIARSAASHAAGGPELPGEPLSAANVLLAMLQAPGVAQEQRTRLAVGLTNAVGMELAVAKKDAEVAVAKKDAEVERLVASKLRLQLEVSQAKYLDVRGMLSMRGVIGEAPASLREPL